MEAFSSKNLTELCEVDELNVRGGTSLFYDDFSSIAISDPRGFFLFPGQRSPSAQYRVTTSRTADGAGVSISAVVQSN